MTTSGQSALGKSATGRSARSVARRSPRSPRVARHASLGAAILITVSCGGGPGQEDGRVTTAHDTFLQNLSEPCGEAFDGEAVQVPEGDELFSGSPRLVAHFWECSRDQVKIPFHVGEDRSRTWILTRSSEGIDLRHDHRHPDGTPEENTMYGAHSVGLGSPTRQEFLSQRDDGGWSGWAIEIVPGERYTYGTLRDGEWRYRLDFDLTSSVPVPPLPWGQE